MNEMNVRKSPCETNRANPGEEDTRKSLSEQIARASSNKTSQHANSNESAGRKSLSERIAHANAARVDGAWSTPDEQLVEAERRTPLPSRAAYLARTNPRAATHPDNRSIKAHTQVGNPACAFVWEIRNNKEGALAKSSDAQYAKALDATDALKDLWEDEPWLDELQIAKALIAQIVLLDDDLRAKVLKRANLMAKECADTLAPYLRG